jgi:hypothetical protein
VGELKNELSWSFSRDERMRRCPRQYWFQHYGSWNGWSRDADPFTRELYRLTKLEQRATWQGSIVHRVIARALDGARQGRPAPSPDDVVAEALGWMRQDFADSRDDVARRASSFKAHVRFLEHEQPHDPADPRWRRQWKDAAELVESCVRRFFASEHWSRLSRLPQAGWIEIEDWTGRAGPGAFEIDGVKVFAKIDCAFREDGRPVVLDWKTGRSDEGDAPRQLAVYALYMRERHGIDPSELVAREVNVALGTVHEHDVSPEALESFLVTFRASVARMRALLSDPRGNVPLPQGDFALTEDERECRRCRFRPVCPKTSAAM